MKATVLSDNIPAENLGCEWGLSIFIEYHGKHILLDAGASGLFLKNADVLGLNMKDVDFGVLSHAHYDHADGVLEFFRVNSFAPFYFRKLPEKIKAKVSGITRNTSVFQRVC